MPVDSSYQRQSSYKLSKNVNISSNKGSVTPETDTRIFIQGFTTWRLLNNGRSGLDEFSVALGTMEGTNKMGNPESC